MRSQFSYALAAITLVSSALADQYVVYWGQNTNGLEKPLKEYCNQADIINISFLNTFDGVNAPRLDLSSHCSGGNCANVGEDIKYCQQKGKKIILSLGGAIGEYGLATPQAAENFASQLYNGFLKGTSGSRPFGSAAVDGIDLDLENGRSQNLVTFLTKLRQLQPSVIVAAAPQCVYPDATLGEALEKSQIDLAFVQFYNNPVCNIDGGFNFEVWNSWAQRKGAKLFVGVPAAPRSANNGYVNFEQLVQKISKVKGYSSYAGVMMWDAPNAFGENGYGAKIADYLHGQSKPETPIIEKPVVKPETPVVKPETPIVKPETPIVKPETPIVKPETPVVEKPVYPETPVVKPETPVTELPDCPETPIVKPETPIVNPETPIVKPETPIVNPETPIVNPETPIVNPETPIVKPETPIVNPETPIVKPETPVVKPETPIVEKPVYPETPVVNPETPIVKPETPVVKPETPVVNPETPIVKPETPVVKPETPVVNPETPIVKPETPVVKPETPIVEKPVYPETPVVKPAEPIQIQDPVQKPTYNSNPNLVGSIDGRFDYRGYINDKSLYEKYGLPTVEYKY